MFVWPNITSQKPLKLQNLRKNLFYNSILSFAQLLVPLITIPYVSRILDPAGIGRVSFMDSFTWYFITLAEFGISTYGIREIARSTNSKKELSRTASEIMMLHIVASGITLIIYGIAVFATWYRIGDIRLVLFSVSFFLVSAFSCDWYFIGLERFRFIAFRDIVTRLLGLISIFLLIKNTSDYYLYYAIIAGTAIVGLLWNLVLFLREMSPSFQNINWKKHFRRALPIFQVSILFAASIWLDNVLLGLFSTITALGYYAFAIKLIRMSGAIITDMLIVLYPRMVALLHQNEYEKAQTTNLQSIRLITILIVPLCVGLYLVAEPFANLYFGPQFSAAIIDIKILSLYPLIKSYSLYLNRQVLLPMQKDRIVVKGLAAGFISLVICMALLCPSLNDVGASISILISESVTVVFLIYFLHKHERQMLLFDPVIFIQAIAASALFIPVVYFIQRLDMSTFQELVVTIVLCMLVYFSIQLVVFRNRLLKDIYRFAAWFVRNKQAQ